MSDIFISYARDDRETAQRLAITRFQARHTFKKNPHKGHADRDEIIAAKAREFQAFEASHWRVMDTV